MLKKYILSFIAFLALTNNNSLFMMEEEGFQCVGVCSHPYQALLGPGNKVRKIENGFVIDSNVNSITVVKQLDNGNIDCCYRTNKSQCQLPEYIFYALEQKYEQQQKEQNKSKEQ